MATIFGNMLKKIPGWVKLLLKIAVTGLCLWFVGRKINWVDTWHLLQQSQKLWLMAGLIFFIASKVLSSFRLNLYFKNIGISLSQSVNLKLYWLGMFYNLFLPGGIGGDAYKVILLHQNGHANSYKKTSAAVLLDRLSGVAGLGILAAGCYFIIYRGAQYSGLILASIIPGLFVYWLVVKKFFPSFTASFIPTLGLGIGVQLLQMVCIWCVMQSIGLQHHFFEFQLLFLLSSIVAILPFTIGGLGARELVFLWGATQFGLQQHEAVFISLLFYLITVIASLFGLVYVFKNPISPLQNSTHQSKA